MSLSSSPKLIKGGLVILDAGSGAVKRTIALQYNPDTLSRTYQVQGAGGHGGAGRAQPFGVKGPTIESLKFDAEFDATDALERPEQNADTVELGIAPHLAALESLVSPSAAELLAWTVLSKSGSPELLPPEVYNYCEKGWDPLIFKSVALKNNHHWGVKLPVAMHWSTPSLLPRLLSSHVADLQTDHDSTLRFVGEFSSSAWEWR
jgi:hypothetical protein